MTKILSNVLIQGMSGRVGDLVITRDGRVRTRPDVSNRKWSARQCSHLNRVQEGKAWARQALSDPVLGAWYASLASKKPGLGAWHIAISDYYNRPQISQMTISRRVMDHPAVVHIHATDKFKVRSVNVKVSGPGDAVLETVAARQEHAFYDWTCEIRTDVFRLPGLTLTVEASDTPGNLVTACFAGPFRPDEIIVPGETW